MKYLHRLKTYFISRTLARLPGGPSLVLAYHTIKNCSAAGTDIYGGNKKPHSGDPYRIPSMMVVDALAATLFSQIVSTIRNQRST